MHAIIDGDLFGGLALKDLWAGDLWLLGIERSTTHHTQSWMLTLPNEGSIVMIKPKNVLLERRSPFYAPIKYT